MKRTAILAALAVLVAASPAAAGFRSGGSSFRSYSRPSYSSYRAAPRPVIVQQHTTVVHQSSGGGFLHGYMWGSMMHSHPAYYGGGYGVAPGGQPVVVQQDPTSVLVGGLIGLISLIIVIGAIVWFIRRAERWA